jgi:glyoxylase-like metal-dependent hydrolase (beta-lactamase superfamily II)
VRFLVVGPTHTRGDTAFFVEQDSVLFAGDVVMNNSFLAANQASSMKAWLSAFVPSQDARALAWCGGGRGAHLGKPRLDAGSAGAGARAEDAGPLAR